MKYKDIEIENKVLRLKVLAYKQIALQFCNILDKIPKPAIKDIKFGNYQSDGCNIELQKEDINPKFIELEKQIDNIIRNFVED